MKKQKNKIWIIALATVVILSFVGFGAVKASQNKKEVGMIVKTAVVEKQDIESHILTSGEVMSIDKRQIMTDVMGKVEKVFVKEGDRVKAGQILLQIDASEIEHQIRQAELKLAMDKDTLNQLKGGNHVSLEIAISNAEIQYNDAQNTYEKKKELFESGIISKNELDMAKSAMNQANNAYILAKKNLENAKDTSQATIQEKQIQMSELSLNKLKGDVEKYTIKSPIAGTVVSFTAVEGDRLSQAVPIAMIQDTDTLEITTNISEYDIHKIAIGQEVKITGDAFEDKVYVGKIKYIGPFAVSLATGQGKETVVEVKIEVTEHDAFLKPGFTAKTDIMTESKTGILVVPYEAIFTKKDGEKIIFTMEDGEAKELSIKTGIESDLVVEVIGQELKEKDKVILNPTEKLKTGDKVRENKVTANAKN